MTPLLPDKPDDVSYRKRSHPAARKLLKDEIFWMPGDENGPISDDAGSETLAEFWDWRDDNGSTPVSVFLGNFLEEYGITHERVLVVANSDPKMCVGNLHQDANLYDDLVLAAAFGQFMKEGCIDSDMHLLALRSVQRQSDESVLDYRCAEPKDRFVGLQKTRKALEKMRVKR